MYPVILNRERTYYKMSALYSKLRETREAEETVAPLRRTASVGDLPKSTPGALSHPPRFDYGAWTMDWDPPIYFMGELPQDNVQNTKVICTRIARDILQDRGPFFTIYMFQQKTLAAPGFTLSAIPLHTPHEAYAVALAFDRHLLISQEEQRDIARGGFRLREPAILRDDEGDPRLSVNRVSNLRPTAMDGDPVPPPPPTYQEAMGTMHIGPPDQPGTAQPAASSTASGASGTSSGCPHCASHHAVPKGKSKARGKGKGRKGKG